MRLLVVCCGVVIVFWFGACLTCFLGLIWLVCICWCAYFGLFGLLPLWLCLGTWLVIGLGLFYVGVCLFGLGVAC